MTAIFIFKDMNQIILHSHIRILLVYLPTIIQFSNCFLKNYNKFEKIIKCNKFNHSSTNLISELEG